MLYYTRFDINRKIRRNTFWRVAPPTGKPRDAVVRRVGYVLRKAVACVGKHRGIQRRRMVALAVAEDGKNKTPG